MQTNYPNKLLLSILVLIFCCACASITKKSMLLNPGMSKQEVLNILGTPDGRSFKGEDEAWQYQEIVGFGQCSYIIAWFYQGRLVAATNRRGGSVAGCGLGSREVDWGQMPKPSVDVNINYKEIK